MFSNSRQFRIETLNKIIAQAKLSEVLTNDIQMVEQNKQIPNVPIFTPYNEQPFSIAISGATVWVPTNPIIGGVKQSDSKFKGGHYNVFVWIRPGNLSSNGKMRSINTNAVIVTVDAGGMGSSENTNKYGNSAFLSNVLSTIDTTMKKHFGDVELGNIGLGAFSGGYDAVGHILSDLQTKSNLNSIYQKVNAVMMLDNMHNDTNNAFKNYAQEAAKNPNKKFIAMYSQINPGSYKSSRQAAEEIAQHVGAKKQSLNGERYGKVSPNSISSINGVKLIEAYPEEWGNQPSRKYDPVSKKYVGSIEGTLQNQHVMISDAAPDLMNELSSWNS